MTYPELLENLQTNHPEVIDGKMFGMPVFKNDAGKALGGEWHGDMVFKLVDETARKQALSLSGAELFDPGMGRPMKEWVVVPAKHSDSWPELAEAAYKGMKNG